MIIFYPILQGHMQIANLFIIKKSSGKQHKKTSAPILYELIIINKE